MLDKLPQLETENLILRQVHLSDAEDVFQVFSNREVMQYHDVTPFTRIEQAKMLIERWSERFKNLQGMRWGIAKKDDNRIIGSCGYGQWNKKLFRAEVGYELNQAYWRQGIMTEALSAVIKFGFNNMELNRIEAMVMLENTPSMKLLEKLGFIDEGILRESGFWMGIFHDLRLFALLKKDCFIIPNPKSKI